MITADNYIGNFKQKVLSTINAHRLIEPGDRVLVGISGGPDSVCLLHVLYSLRDALRTDLYAIHVNHMLRNDEADADEKFTLAFCNELNVPVFVVHADVAAIAREKGMSIEEAGRYVRYREFARCAENVGASKIAVAHNRNDQAETVMMNIIRGTGTAGLVGMEFARGKIIRPLLGISREEIELYCKRAGLSPRTDSSNLTGDYTRNKVRIGLFPYIDENFKANIVDSLCRLSANAAEDNSYLEHCASEEYQRAVELKEAGQVTINIDRIQKLAPAILNRVMKLAVCDLKGSSAGIGNVHYGALSDLVAKRKTGTQLVLPGGVKASVSYGKLRFSSADPLPPASFCAALNVPGVTFVPALNCEFKASIEKAADANKCYATSNDLFIQYFDYDRLNKGINIRNRQKGDVFKPFRSNGTKKLKKYFIDKKIPREERDRIPLVCTGNEVVWIIGDKISDKFKVTENTKTILKIECNRRGST